MDTFTNVLVINSNDRETSKFPNSNEFTIELLDTYRNVKCIDLIYYSLENVNDITLQPLLYLEIPEISRNRQLIDTNGIVNPAFVLSLGDYDNNYVRRFAEGKFRTEIKLGNLSKLTLRVKKPDGSLFDTGECYFIFKIIQESNQYPK